MKYDAIDRQGRSLLEMEVTFHPQAIMDLFIGRDGMMARFAEFLLLLGIVWLLAGLQLSWPQYYLEIPFYPLVMLVVAQAAAGSCGRALAAALAGGFLLDCGMMMPVGCNGIFLVIAALAASLIRERLSEERWPIFQMIAAGASGALVYSTALLVFYGGSLAWTMRFRLFLCRGLLGTILAGLVFGPAISFLCSLVFWRRRKSSTGAAR